MTLGNLSAQVAKGMKDQLESILSLVSFSLTPIKGKFYTQKEALFCISKLAKAFGNFLLPHLKNSLSMSKSSFYFSSPLPFYFNHSTFFVDRFGNERWFG